MPDSVYPFNARSIDGQEISLDRFKGKVLLVVNTASECGYTPQYAGLEDLYKKYNGRGLRVLGFPCNQFGAQEPGTEKEIKAFCEKNYGVTFPMFAKVEVNGDGAHPLFTYLKQALPGLLGSEKIKWNFTKFLIDKNGAPVKRFSAGTEPASLRESIEALL